MTYADDVLGERSEAELANIKDQLDLAAERTSAAVASQAERAASIESRAGLLTAAAAVVGSVQVTTASTIWVPVLLIFSFAAAVLGLLVARPRWQGVIDPAALAPGVLNLTPLAAKYRVMKAELNLYHERRQGIRVRAVIVLIGYGCLAASVGATLVVALIPVAPK